MSVDLSAMLGIVRREWRATCLNVQGLVSFLAFFLTFGLAMNQAAHFVVLPQFATVHRALNAMTALDVFIVPLVGVLLGYAAVAGEVESGTIHFLLSRPVTRGTVLCGKYIGRFLTLTTTLATAGAIGLGILFIQVALLRRAEDVDASIAAVVGDGGVIFSYLASLWLLAGAFLAISILVSTAVKTSVGALSGGIGFYAVLAIGWNAFFRLDAGATAGGVFVRNISPFAAWLAWSRSVMGAANSGLQTVVDTVYSSVPFLVAVLVAWSVAALLAALIIFERRDVA